MAQQPRSGSSDAPGASGQSGTSGQRPDFDISRLLSEMKLPAMPDVQALGEASRRNIEALTAANRVALEGAQAVARRHMEIMQQAVSEMSEGMKALTVAETPQAKAAKQAELVKQGYQRAVTNLQELGDLIQRSNSEALNLLNRRFAEAMDELKSMAEKKA
ncbi:MAG TPA: phasin family protein [Acetobacteraceae bacterium]|nr:phasin family protein [Acetobacteraceae bacterium]